MMALLRLGLCISDERCVVGVHAGEEKAGWLGLEELDDASAWARWVSKVEKTRAKNGQREATCYAVLATQVIRGGKSVLAPREEQDGLSRRLRRPYIHRV